VAHPFVWLHACGKNYAVEQNALIMVERYAHQNSKHIKTVMDKMEERYKKVV